jgi:hypothetical protein
MEKVNIIYAGVGVQSQNLLPQDRQLIVSNFINSAFGEQDDYLELYIYDEGGALLEIDYDAFDYYPYLTANPKNNTYSDLVLDPEKDLKNRGFNRGNLKIQYNFYKRLFNSAFNNNYWIKEISTSRTEIKLASQTLSNTNIVDGFSAYQTYISTKNYYPIFYLNFGNNQTVIATNVAYTEDEQGGYLLVKLYEPLPTEYDLKTQLWIVDKVAESVSFDVTIEVQSEQVQDLNRLRGPNYNVLLNTKNGQTTPYYNYNNLLASPVTSSYQKLLSYYQDKGIQINVDYSNFKNFVHFSSAVERVNNFVYKIQLIENANTIISEQQLITANTTYVSSSISLEQKTIENIIKNFDTYEYFLYFESSSWAWPKSNDTQPYQLYSITSSEVSNFLGGVNAFPTSTTQSLLWSASYYDSTNKDLLHNSIPQYILDDTANQPFITFLDMIGQHFDNVWIYYKDVTNRFNATNNPNTGISLDMVSDALQGLGFQLFTNTNVSDNLYYTLFGINPGGSLLPPTGSEIITQYVTSSLTTLPAETIQDELYKRLYHNLPYLLKTKGSLRGVKALVATYGLPEEILTVREFGGNNIESLVGVLDLNTSEYKINIVTGSQTLSSSLLSPYATIQYYEGDTRLNNTNIEVGFSPADVINANISSSQGFFNVDQLIGSPALRYSSSYNPLVSASNEYFSNYTQQNSIWEYIRLLKFYNNSLFKTIKNFVPARSNISTGLIIKSHLYERNKYARHEPTLTFNDYSQSIEILDVSGGIGGAITGSTAWSDFFKTAIGLVPYSSSQNQELYTGEFNGSYIIATDGSAMQQGIYTGITPVYGICVGYDESDGGLAILDYALSDCSNTNTVEVATTGLISPFYNYGALHQNINSYLRSKNLIDLDYNSDQLIPVNYGAVTYSLNLLNTDAYAAYTNPNNPFAQVQDYNYNLIRSLLPRYIGSKTISAKYNDYIDGDQSYGKTAAIDKIKYQYAYLVDIYTASAFLPRRSNAQIKYLIDDEENVLDLTKANKNIFEVQNIFKSGETVNVSIFDYDESNPYTQKLANDPTIAIYEGGWRYLPILHNVSRSSPYQQFEFTTYPKKSVEVGSGISPDSPFLDTDNYRYDNNFDLIVQCVPTGPNTSTIIKTWIANISSDLGSVDFPVTLTIKYNRVLASGDGSLSCDNDEVTVFATIPKDSNSTSIALIPAQYNSDSNNCFGDDDIQTFNDQSYICEFNIISVTGGSIIIDSKGSTTETFYTEFFTSSACLYLLTQSNEIVFDPTLSYWYNSPFAPLTFSSSGDIDWANSGLSPVVVPFQLSTGDKISFYNSQSLGWSELSEYTIKNVRTSGSNTSTSSSVLLAEIAESINVALFSSGSGIPTESFTGTPFRNCRYIVWKHVPDETNVILNYNPTSPSLVENGILFPQYIDLPVRENAGNVIKSLKQQNLI